MIRVPSPDEYRAKPYAERLRLVLALKALLASWAETERP